MTLCQGLTLIQLSSDLCKNEGQGLGGQLYEDECDWSEGIKVNISATVLYFGAALACCLTPPKADDAFSGGSGDDEGTAQEHDHAEVKGVDDRAEVVKDEGGDDEA